MKQSHRRFAAMAFVWLALAASSFLSVCALNSPATQHHQYGPVQRWTAATLERLGIRNEWTERINFGFTVVDVDPAATEFDTELTEPAL